MAVHLSPLYADSLMGDGLQLAGEGIQLAGGKHRSLLQKARTVVHKGARIADKAAPLAEAFAPELAPGIVAAQAGLHAADSSLQGAGYGKGTQRKVIKVAKKAGNIGMQLVDEFGSQKQKRQAAKAARVAEIVGSGKPGSKLRARVMAHN